MDFADYRRRLPVSRTLRWTAALAAAWLLVATPFAQSSYSLYTSDSRRPVAFRSAGPNDFIALELLSGLFGLKVEEDPAVGGLTIATRGQRIFAFPGQSFVRVGERVVSLPGQIQRERGGWQVPVEFLSLALGPAIGTRIEVRRESKLILVGEVRVPKVTGTLEKTGTGARLQLDVQPPTPHKISRDGSRLVVRFDAAALDAAPIKSAAGDFAKSVRVEGSSLIVELGPATAEFRVDGDARSSRLGIDLDPPGPPPPPVAPPTPAPRPVVPGAPPPPPPPPGDGTGLRIVVIDPGHGGADEGARGPSGVKEKDLTLAVARRLKAAIEGRMGLRVLLPRDGDEALSIDQRTALANNNKADMFVSLHANAATRPSVHGAQVLSLAAEDYGARGELVGRGAQVPVVGGAMRTIAAVPWDLAQIPFATRSAAVAALLVERLGERQVPLHTAPAAQMPLRVLVGANMPAILLEMGFLSNVNDEAGLGTAERQDAIVDALVQTIGQIRRGVPAPVPGVNGR
jgi:N-acetylmuramoyl-L-alanine amidase